jgi:glycosyltransferase involved in cell wall biosynthesis
MIGDNETGVLVPPRAPERLAAALERLLQSPEERKRLGHEARRRCEELFSIEGHIQAVLNQYDIVLTRCTTAVPSTG